MMEMSPDGSWMMSADSWHFTINGCSSNFDCIVSVFYAWNVTQSFDAPYPDAPMIQISPFSRIMETLFTVDICVEIVAALVPLNNDNIPSTPLSTSSGQITRCYTRYSQHVRIESNIILSSSPIPRSSLCVLRRLPKTFSTPLCSEIVDVRNKATRTMFDFSSPPLLFGNKLTSILCTWVSDIHMRISYKGKKLSLRKFKSCKPINVYRIIEYDIWIL